MLEVQLQEGGLSAGCLRLGEKVGEEEGEEPLLGGLLAGGGGGHGQEHPQAAAADVARAAPDALGGLGACSDAGGTLVGCSSI